MAGNIRLRCRLRGQKAASCARDQLPLGVFHASRSGVRLTHVNEWPEPEELFGSAAELPRDKMSQRQRPGLPMTATGDPASQARLIAALTDPAVFGPGCERVRHLETHISHVLLTGAYAYKIKKPVDLGFLDFTTLAQRKLYCEQELRLNRRLAPAIYLDVVAITGSVDRPVIGGDGPVVEYAVKMREFAQEALASRMLAAGVAGCRPRRRAGRGGRRLPRPRRDGGRGHALRVAGHDPARRAAELRLDPPDARRFRRSRAAGCASRVDGARARAAARHIRAAQGGRLRARMPRGPPSQQHRRHRWRGHRLRLHRVQRRAALDRRDERNRVHDDGSCGPRAAGPRAPVRQRVSREHRRLRGTGGVSVLPRLPRDGAGEDRLPAARPAGAGRRDERRSSPNTAATSISPPTTRGRRIRRSSSRTGCPAAARPR